MSSYFFARKQFSGLTFWKNNQNKAPLILLGARQVGKTKLLEHFGEKEYRKTHYINFEQSREYNLLFAKDLDPKRILQDLGLLLKTEIHLDQDLIVFDELQLCSEALTSLKYFAEDMQGVSIIGAGSLLGLNLSPGSFPVGKVDFSYLFPLSFSEFVESTGDHKAADLYRNISLADLQEGLSPAVKHHLWGYFLQYLVTGGMPAVVREYNDKTKADPINVYSAIRAVQSNIVTSYESDIAKHSGKVNAMKISRIFTNTCTQITKRQDESTKKFSFSDVGLSGGYRGLSTPIDWLQNARLVHKFKIIENSEHPLEAFTEDAIFKLFLIDIGLLGAATNLDPLVLLNMNFGTYKGAIAEQFVAQELIASSSSKVLQNTFYCWDKKSAEVEFVANTKFGIIPFEVKSGVRVQAKSLKQYEKKYAPQFSVIFGGRGDGLSSDKKRLFVPIFMAERLWELLKP